ncbi:hypothetical protein N7448_011402 [Penicillium atrosanguineum]|nr:hypothetical protein N7448_011402 [Penicillium atrosanguineum]
MTDLEEAIRVSRQAVQATPNDHPQLIGWLNNLANELESRYDRTGQIDDLEEAIRVSRQAIQATPSNHPEITWLLNSLGNKLGRRYERRGLIEDLDEAIRVYRQAVKTTPDDYLNLIWLLSGLGNMLESRYERKEQMNDLDEAIRVSRLAVQATPNNHPLLAELLNNLGNKLAGRYKRTGQIEDIQEAIRVSCQAVQATPNNHLSLVKFLNSLGYQLGSRYERIGRIEDLEEAVQVCRRALKITAHDHPNLAVLLNNLARRLESRYERRGQIKDLEEAILLSRQAVKTTSDDHPNLAMLLNSLGNQVGLRYERTAQMNDLEEAIWVYRKAIKTTSHDHPNLAGLLNNLGGRLESRFELKGQMDDLEEAIRFSRQAVAATPHDHPNLAMWFNNLANMLERRFEQTRQKEDLREAIQLSRQVVQITPDNHPQLAGYLNNLGTKLGHQYEQTRQKENLEEAVRLSHQAFKATTSPPLSRITAATLALRLLIEQEDHHTGYTLSVEAIELLKLVNNRSLTLQDQQYVLSHFSGLATQACSLALQTGQPIFEALLLLESGRGVILSLLMNDQSATSQLKMAQPALCALYESLRLEVNTPVESTKSQPADEPNPIRRPKALKELENCIQDIQNLPGFGSFQRGLTKEKVETASNEGSIIVVNVTILRSDAIIVSSAGFSLVPLPQFDAVQAQGWLDKKLTSPGERGVKNKIYLQFLAWLWRECVKPVLNELGHYAQSSLEDLPRVWWIGTGLASSFPFHAACDISAEPTENTFSRVLSSYTPSIKALLNSRERTSTSPSSSKYPLKLLMVTMATTPGADDLPGDILSVLKLCENRSTDSEIAYLSACSTAENQANRLIDEVLHVVSGFQVAGFRHVIGTLWPSDDRVCVEVARSFYAELCRNGALEYTERAVAMALHKAVLVVSTSDDHRKRPLHWAQYVHYGA